MYTRLLLVRRILGQITPEESLELDAILESDPDARALRDELQSIPPETLQEAFSSFDVHTGLLDVYDREQDMQRRRRRTIIRSILGTAAAALIAGAVWLTWLSPNASVEQGPLATGNPAGSATLVLEDGTTISLADTGLQKHNGSDASFTNNNRVLQLGSDQAPGEGWTTLVVPARLDYQVKLSDGSTVWLNSLSRLRFRFENGKQREVFLEAGEAYFKVTGDVQNPFTVHTPEGDVQVLGTEFNVNAYSEKQMVASLINGKVAIRHGVDRIELNPGHQALVNAGETIVVENFDPARTLSWREGVHFFDDAAIKEISTMLDRWFNVELVIDSPDVGRRRFFGRLDRNKPIQDFVNAMNLTGEVNFYWKGNKLHAK